MTAGTTSAPRESASFAYFSSLVRTMVADPPKGQGIACFNHVRGGRRMDDSHVYQELSPAKDEVNVWSPVVIKPQVLRLSLSSFSACT